jgi:YfiH family protein
VTAVLPLELREEPAGDAAIPRLELRAWRERFGLIAGITTREHGFSLGLWSDEPIGQVMNRWRAFRAAVRPAFPTVILGHQVHGTVVGWHERTVEGLLVRDEQDGQATNAPGVLLTVTVADCIPVYLAVPDQGLIALLHAGWRGTAGKILQRGVELLKRHGCARASDIVMHCGVGICGPCYEVGPEVASQLSGRQERGAQHVDLRRVLHDQARDLGIGEITRSGWCSAHDRDRFFSHRASGGTDGRMVAFLGRPLA